MAAPTPQTFGALAGANRTTAQIPVPSGVAANDIIIVGLYKESTAAITPPAGFTLKTTVSCSGAELHDVSLFWKRASGADTGTYDFSWTGSAWAEGQSMRVSGAILSGDPFGTPLNSATSNSVGSSAVTPAVATLTPSEANCLVFFIGSNYNAGANWTPPTGFTERGTDGMAITIGTLAQTTATATGSVTATATTANLGRTGLVAYLKSDTSGNVAGTTTASSTITGRRTDSGAVTGTATASGTVTGLRTGIGAVTGTSTASATVTAATVKSVVGTATASATITANKTDVASVTGTATAAATVTAQRVGIGSVDGTATASATITAVQIAMADLAGTATAEASIVAQLAVPVSGDIAGLSVASATIRAVTGYYFRTPSQRIRPYTRHGLWSRTYIDSGISLLKFGSSYQQSIDADPELLATADVIYYGGHIYFVDPIEALSLIAAGYGSWVTDDPYDPLPDIDYSAYGVGLFGTGPYGE